MYRIPFIQNYRPNLWSFSNYILENKKSKLETKLLDFFSLSTGSTDEIQSNCFAYLFHKNTDEVFQKLQMRNNISLDKYLKHSFEFYSLNHGISLKDVAYCNEKIEKLRLICT